jgi:transcriptional regulator with XRE-family HTH domain
MATSKEILEAASTFGDAVRRLRENKKMTLRDLASRLKVSAPFLSDIEHDRRKPTVLSDLATHLGVAEEDLKKLDPRVTPDLKKWMDSNPSVVALLDEFRKSGQDPEQLLRQFRAPDRRNKGRSS